MPCSGLNETEKSSFTENRQRSEGLILTAVYSYTKKIEFVRHSILL